jgi:hypothetical protein
MPAKEANSLSDVVWQKNRTWTRCEPPGVPVINFIQLARDAESGDPLRMLDPLSVDTVVLGYPRQ